MDAEAHHQRVAKAALRRQRLADLDESRLSASSAASHRSHEEIGKSSGAKSNAEENSPISKRSRVEKKREAVGPPSEIVVCDFEWEPGDEDVFGPPKSPLPAMPPSSPPPFSLTSKPAVAIPSVPPPKSLLNLAIL